MNEKEAFQRSPSTSGFSEEARKIKKQMEEVRRKGLQAQKRQAEAMKKSTFKKAKSNDLAVGSNVLVHVSEFDRGKTDSRNIF